MADDQATPQQSTTPSKSSPPRDSKGWDGKLRLDKNKEPIVPEGATPPDTDDEEETDDRKVEHVEGVEIKADEGTIMHLLAVILELTDTVQTYWKT